MVDGTRQKVLVVDDEELVRNVCAAMLHNFGYEVLTSSGGMEGLQTFRENSDDIALVVSDIVMPDFSGPEMVRAMTRSGLI
jgi:CheY-like chemotaxis protein